MSGRKAKAARRTARVSAPRPSTNRGPAFLLSWQGGLVAIGVVAIITASFVLPGVLNKKATSSGATHAMALGVEQGHGLPAGAAVPSFSASDLLTGQKITSSSVYGHKTLLFFSEGVMCQACLEQITGLQQVGAALEKRGIRLISITTDTPADLAGAARDYGITTPLIADENGRMSSAFNTLGLGMHSTTPGHAFALIDHGKVLWYRDYWLPPYRTMYVQPGKLLSDIPAA